MPDPSVNLESKWIDFHCHSMYDQSADCIEIISCHPGRNTSEGLSTHGYHPWWTHNVLNEDQLNLLRALYQNSQNCLALGECGLDKMLGPEFDIQVKNFESQVHLANQINAPVIIHCVRKFDTLLSIYKNMAKTSWVIHGFKRNVTLLKTLLDCNISISVAPYQNMNISFEEALHYVPTDKVFIETDSDRRLSIKERYKIFSTLRKIPEDSLKLQMNENCKTLFNKKWH